MRHRIHGRKLGRTSAHRKALFRNQLTALFTHERITTTLAKAKDLRPLAERMVTLARTGTLPARRKVLTMVSDKDVVRRLFETIAPRFMERPGGYTRILRLGRRHGDGAEMAIIEFVDFEISEKEAGGGREKKPSFMDRARSMFGGGEAKETEAAEEAETAEAAAAEVEAEPEVAEEAAEPVEEEAAAAEAETVAEEAPAEAEAAESEDEKSK